MKTTFATLAAVLVTLCFTSTALAETPAPAPGNAQKNAGSGIPQFYYSETREDVRPPKINAGLKNIEVFEGDEVCFEIKFDESGICEVLVYHDAVEISNDKRYEHTREKNVFRLWIRDIRLEDSGKYSCVVKNELGMVSTSGALIVLESKE